MNRKKVILLAVSLFIFSLVSTIVLAAPTDYMPDILEDFFKWLFFTLPEQARSGNEAFVYWFKLILWLLLFPVVFFGANKIFPDSRRISGVIAGVFSLIAVIFIPKGILLFIFTEFSAVTSLILALAPIFIGIFIRSKIPDDLPMLKNGIMLIVGVVLITTGGYFTAAYLTGDNKLFEQFGVWATATGAVALIWGILGFLFGFGLGKGGEGSGEGGGLFGKKGEAGESVSSAKEEKKLKKEEAKAEANVANLTSQMQVIEQKLQRIEAIEQQDYYAKLHSYENQLKVLDELDNILAGSWNALETLRNVLGKMQAYPQHYKDMIPEIEQHLSTFNSFIQKLYDVLNQLVQNLTSQLTIDRHEETLGEAYKKAVRYMRLISKLDLNQVKLILKEVHGEERLKKKITTAKTTEVNDEIAAIKALNKGMIRKLWGFNRILKDDQKVQDNLKKMDQDDYNKIKKAVDAASGMVRDFKTAYERWRSAGYGRVMSLIKALSGMQNIRAFAKDIREVRQSTLKKIDTLKKHKTDIQNKWLLTKDFKELTLRIKNIDAILLKTP
ncbi:hypothetical protein HYU09_04310 [Candidatus Woesearchaeota archaeon]|nr:hypothetical protein [Candidatus Woesearchaeota archaeon]